MTESPRTGDFRPTATGQHASAIVCRIMGQRLGDARLRGRALHCAGANATMGAADVIPEAGSEE